MSTKDMSWKELSARGGKARAKNRSHKELSDIAKKGVNSLRAKYGDNYFKDLAKKGLEGRNRKKLESKNE